jgi:hypothetical protein
MRSKDSFSGKYYCSCVQDYCEVAYENGISKIGNRTLNDDTVWYYFVSMPDPIHVVRNGKLICTKTDGSGFVDWNEIEKERL